MASETTAPQPSLTEMTRDAQLLRAEGRHAEAIDVLKSIIDIAPDNVAVLHNYAAALGDAGRAREAVAVLQQAFSKGLNAPESWLVYARAQMALQAFKEAQAAFGRLFALRPYDHSAHKEFAQLVWMQTGDRERALKVLDQAINENPNHIPLHIARAQVYGQTGDQETEYLFMREVVRRSGGDPRYSQAACDAALAAKKYDEALEFGRRAAAGLPGDLTAIAAYASALLAVGESAEALDVLAPLAAADPFNQFIVALQATAWRMLDDPRYERLYDYNSFVRTFELACPQGWKSVEAYVDDLTEALEAAHRFRTHPFHQSVKGGSQISSIDGSDNPAMAAFREAAAGPVGRYVSELSSGDDPLRSRTLGGWRFYSTWSISLPPAGYHINHVHPQGWLSSACHVRPAQKEPGAPRAGWLKFGEPGVATSPPLEAQHFVEPKAGVMAVFPS